MKTYNQKPTVRFNTMTGRFEKKVGCVMLIFFVLRALLALAIGGGAAWVVIHFLVKYW